jgi:TolB-like protein
MTSRWLVPLSGLLLLTPATAGASAVQRVPTWLAVPGSPAAQSAPVATSAGAAPETAAEAMSVLAVLPFSNISQDAADDWIGDGFADTVAAELASLADLVVVGPAAVTSAVTAEPLAPIDPSAAARVGRALGARWVVNGGYQRVGPLLRVTSRLVDTRTGEVVDTLTADGTMDEFFELQDRVTTHLVLGVAAAGRPRVPVATGLGEGEAAGAPAVTAGAAPGDGGDRAGRGVSGNRPGGAVGLGRPGARAGLGGAPGEIVLPRDDASGQPARRPDGRAPGAVSLAGAPAAASAGILTGRPTVTAARATVEPTIDGTLDDEIWRTATRITEFVQTTPTEGAAATEDTEVYIAFDSTHLFVGVYAHYDNPGMMRANRVDRDRASFSDDTISLYFDTFLDQQRAFVFTLNGYGVQGDSLMGGGGGGGFRGGGGGGVPRGDSSWDALFESSGVLVDDGWTAEMAIPFKSLRYPSSEAHRWGFQIARSIRGKDETVVWSPVSRDVSGFMPQMGLLDGLRNLSTSRNLEILPTFTGIQVGNLDRATGTFGEERQPEGGVNVKYGLTSNLTLDFTYNPDFSQIESDRPQIEVNQRFPLFFNELRPFFLEGQEVFDIRGPVTLIHTRTIVDPRYGAKITGKVGKITLGVLVANDEAPGKVDDPTDLAFDRSANSVIARVRYDLYSESHIGAIFTDREFLDSYSRLIGLDGRFRINPTTSADFMAITAENRALDDDSTSGRMFDLGLRHNGRNLNYSVSGYQIDPEFDSEVGFVRRRDIRRASSNVSYRWWPESWIINLGPSLNYSRNWNFDDILEDEEARLRFNVSFAKSIRFNGEVSREMERFGGINFDKTRYGIGGNVNTSRVVSFGGNYDWGEQVRFSGTPFLGDGSSARLFMNLRPFSRLQSSLRVSTSRLVDPADQSEVFDVKIFRAETTYQFTDRLVLRNIMEHNTFNGTLGNNLLLTYRVNSGTVFFVGYDDRYTQGDLIFDDDDEPLFFTTDFERTNRAFFTKISYLFRY